MALFSKRDLIPKFAEGGLIKGFSDYEILLESQDRTKEYNIFLSHSYLNAIEISELKKVIQKYGFSVYVDWIEDKKLSRNNVTKETARILRERMKHCETLIYAHTVESSISKWMQWELGFFDGFKGKVSILPIEEKATGTDDYKGLEYLGLYPYITKEIDDKGIQRLWVNEGNPETFVAYEEYLQGRKLTKRK